VEDLPKNILLLLMFGLPGLFIKYIVSKLTDLPGEKKTDWKKVAIYSTISVYLVHLITLLLHFRNNEKWEVLKLTLDSLASTYKGIPVFILVILISFILAIIQATLHNKGLIEKGFGLIRSCFDLNIKSPKDVWIKQIGSKSGFIAEITFQDGRKEYGITKSYSTSPNMRELYLIMPEEMMEEKDLFLEALNELAPEGIFIDLKNGYSLNIYEPNCVIEKINEKK